MQFVDDIKIRKARVDRFKLFQKVYIFLMNDRIVKGVYIGEFAGSRSMGRPRKR